MLQFFACQILPYVQVITPRVAACTHAQTCGQVPDVFLVQAFPDQAVLCMMKGCNWASLGCSLCHALTCHCLCQHTCPECKISLVDGQAVIQARHATVFAQKFLCLSVLLQQACISTSSLATACMTAGGDSSPPQQSGQRLRTAQVGQRRLQYQQ